MNGYQSVGRAKTMEIAERRISERFEVSLDALITTESGDTCRVKVANISSTGLQFLVDNFQIPKLMPPLDREYKVETVPLQIDITLPAHFDEVKVRLGIAYFNRFSQHQSTMGCRFEEFLSNSSKTLAEYIFSIQQGQSHTQSTIKKLKKQ